MVTISSAPVARWFSDRKYSDLRREGLLGDVVGIPMDASKPAKRPAIVAALIETFGFSPALATAVVFLVAALLGLAALGHPLGAAAHRRAHQRAGRKFVPADREQSYQKALAKRGVVLEIRPSGWFARQPEATCRRARSTSALSPVEFPRARILVA